MPSTDSDELGKVVDMPLERVVGMARNEWTASVGIDGRHGPDYAPSPPPNEDASLSNDVYLSEDLDTLGPYHSSQPRG